MMKTLSPLRYPGGKTSLAGFLRNLIELNVEDCIYYELYAGGAGAALSLLFDGIVKRIVLNDADIHIFSFWHSILYETEVFIKKIEDTAVNMESWQVQREIYNGIPDNYSTLELGFATFFLNRCNRSGIIKDAGPIGGYNQDGNYSINCRYNKIDLIRRIQRIAQYSEQIDVSNEDTLHFIETHLQDLRDSHAFLYLDPPYYKKGKSLYLNAYGRKDHEALRDLLNTQRDLRWMVSYDNVDEIHELYRGFRNSRYRLNYTLQNRRTTEEFFVFSNSLILPPEIVNQVNDISHNI